MSMAIDIDTGEDDDTCLVAAQVIEQFHVIDHVLIELRSREQSGPTRNSLNGTAP